MRKSLHAAQGMPTSPVRVVIPTQLRRDITLVSRILQLHEGEVFTILLMYALRQLVTRWNEKAVHEQGVYIPELPSLGPDYRGYTLASVLAAMDQHKRRT